MAKPYVQRKENLYKLHQGFIKGKDCLLHGAKVTERISELTEMRVEFVTDDTAVKLEDMVGEDLTIELETHSGPKKFFHGVITSAEDLGNEVGLRLFGVDVRPWFWLTRLTTDSRIFQDKDVKEIISECFNDLGFADHKFQLQNTHPKRVYCVQYDETVFDFACRLMQEEGIFYFFEYENGKNTLVMADSQSAYEKIGISPLDYRELREKGRSEEDHIFEWARMEDLKTGKVELSNYDFTKPKTEFKGRETTLPDFHYGQHSNYEEYRQEEFLTEPNIMADGQQMTQRAKERMQRHEAGSIRWRGAGNARGLATGFSMVVKDTPPEVSQEDVVMISATHYMLPSPDPDNPDKTREEKQKEAQEAVSMANRIEFPESMVLYLCEFEVMESKFPFTPPLVTERPKMIGIQTAVVTGPRGEEIHTDKYGRIKVQFHWDRKGKKDERTTCWVRCVMPWTGKKFGMIHIPRIGNEAVIQFEDGNIDKPLCTGMVYNEDFMPPYTLPDNKTQSGIKTQSSKPKGPKSLQTHNELMFEDKYEEEKVRFVAERDYEQLVRNNAKINIGEVHQDEGNMELTIENDRTETINVGNCKKTIKKGNQALTLDQGNQSVTLKEGDQKIDIKAGKGTTTAAQSFEIKVGTSSIKLEPSKITIKSTQIDIKADAKLSTSAGAASTHNGGGMAEIKAAIVKIN